MGGSHPLAWDALRSFGPTTSRFDHHHPPPPRNHRTRRIAYLATGPEAFTAVLAEWFQDGGSVGPFDLARHRPVISVFETAAPVTLLDLDGGWVTRAGGNQAIRTGPRGVGRDWPRSIHRHHPTIQGVVHGSSVWGPGRCVALWERAAGAFPARPLASRHLDDAALLPAVVHAALRLGSYVL